MPPEVEHAVRRALPWPSRLTRRDAIRGAIAGGYAVRVRVAAATLFDAGGHAVLPGAVQSAVRAAVERQATRVLGAGGLLEANVSAAVRALDSPAVRAAAAHTAGSAGRRILRSVGLAAGAGATIDAGWALARAVRLTRNGSLTPREAVGHVVREAGTGAAATAAGTAAAALLVALTGGVGAPAVFLVGAVASAATKAGMDAWLSARARGAIRVRSA
ncbi:MAG TPA: hypothetical protein VKU41_10740 [Polyangiaceae bacterium]|nr:hypothetical protein [Polyangiaceae bacterium]